MSPKSTEDLIIKHVTTNEGDTVVDISESLSKKGYPISLATIRKYLRKLHRERKVIRTGVHTFKYKIRK